MRVPIVAASVHAHPPDVTLPGPVVTVVGPTAAGKSAVSIALAAEFGGEVVNVDSMQLYQGMDVGTAKLTVAERAGIAHHVLDIWAVTETASVAEYQRRARDAIADILSRGALPLLVGGSGLYLRAVCEDFEFPGTDPGLRAELEAQLAEHGPAVLHQRLAALDPQAADRILPSNGRRIVRALEVVTLTGESFTAKLPDPAPLYRTVQLGIDLAPAALDERIATRVEAMWAAGFVEEVHRLEAVGLRQGRTASRALGYQQILGHLAGQYDEQHARAATIQATRRFVRRQRSWFRRDATISWLDGAAPDLIGQARAVIGRIAAPSR